MTRVPGVPQVMDAIRKIPTSLPGVFILEPRVFGDERGFFLESYNEKAFAELGIEERFVQDNHSSSRRNVLRGLHYQIKQPQGKLVRVVEGEILDVAVDVRRSSPTFGGWEAVRLSGENKRMLWIPVGICARIPRDFREARRFSIRRPTTMLRNTNARWHGTIRI